MRIRQRSRIAPVVHHLRPLSTYSSPSRSIRSWMFVASELATSGSVMANAERISPSSSGRSQRSFCSSVPNCVSTSMLPVSGALQLHASGAMGAAAHDLGQRRVLDVRQPGAVLRVGMEEVPQPAAARLRLELLHDRRIGVRVAGRAELLLEHRLGGIDALVHERVQALGEVLAALGGLEVHPGIITGRASRRRARRWGNYSRAGAADVVPTRPAQHLRGLIRMGARAWS